MTAKELLTIRRELPLREEIVLAYLMDHQGVDFSRRSPTAIGIQCGAHDQKTCHTSGSAWACPVLKQLVAKGFVERVEHSGCLPRVTYQVTETVAEATEGSYNPPTMKGHSWKFQKPEMCLGMATLICDCGNKVNVLTVSAKRGSGTRCPNCGIKWRLRLEYRLPTEVIQPED